MPTDEEQRVIGLVHAVANTLAWYLKHPEEPAPYVDLIDAAWRDMNRIHSLAFAAQRKDAA